MPIASPESLSSPTPPPSLRWRRMREAVLCDRALRKGQWRFYTLTAVCIVLNHLMIHWHPAHDGLSMAAALLLVPLALWCCWYFCRRLRPCIKGVYLQTALFFSR